MPPKAVKIHLEKEDVLKKYGYHLLNAQASRRRALNKIIADKKSRASMNMLIKRLNVLSIYFKHAKPVLAGRARADVKYVQQRRDKLFPENK